MTELVPATHFANPVTGEVLSLDSPTEDLGAYLADIRDLESRIREEKAIVNRELLARLDKQRKWTLPLGNGLKISAPSDEPGEEWDGAQLHEALCDLADDEVITTDAINAAVEIVVEYKVRKAGLNALRKNPRIAELIAPFCRQAERPRYVKVMRDG